MSSSKEINDMLSLEIEEVLKNIIRNKANSTLITEAILNLVSFIGCFVKEATNFFLSLLLIYDI
jgi:hypothetical protein